MKKYLWLITIVILSSLVFAKGLTFNANLDANPVQQITLGEKDRIDFTLLNANHTMIVDQLFNDSALLALFPYYQNVTYAPITLDKFVAIRLNRTDEVDMIIYLKNLDFQSKNVTLLLRKVAVNLTKLQEQQNTVNIENSSQPINQTVSSPQEYSTLTITAVIIIILALIVIFYILKTNKVI